MKIGVCLESMNLSLRAGLPQAARLGIGGVQVNANGELAPDKLGDTGRREVRNLLKTYHQQITAMNCPLRYGLDVAENQQPRIELIRKVMTLAFELGTRIVIVPCPKLPVEGETVRANLLRDALLDLGRHGDRVGVVLALEIGLDSPELVRDYLGGFEVGSLKVNYDPANLMVNGFDPVQGIIPLHKLVAHTHARDARRTSINMGIKEVRLGSGDIDWLSYVSTLSVVEYTGWLTIERDTPSDHLNEIAQSVEFLRRVLAPNS